MSTQWWFAKETLSNGYTQLQNPAISGGPDRDFNSAQKLTIRFENAWIKGRYDGIKATNDLLISSIVQPGNKPGIHKVHHFQPNTPTIKTGDIYYSRVSDVFNHIVYATNDFTPTVDTLCVTFRVFDIDGISDSVADAIKKGIASATTVAAIAFPAIAPYAPIAAGAGPALLDLVNKLDKHNPIINTRIVLDVNKPEGHAYKLLQPGFLVCFSEDVNAEQLFLGNELKLHYRDTKGNMVEYHGTSYAVLRVSRSFGQAPDYIVNQQIATLLAELENGKGSSAGTAFEFLTSSLNGYNNFKRLDRYKQLKAKPSLSKDEQALLDELANDPALKPYIS